MRRAAMVPGNQKNAVSSETRSIAPQPLSRTARGGKIILSTILVLFMVSSYARAR
jgi:hypothetical protein